MGDTAERFDEWAVVEVMGHRRLAGRVTEVRLAGADLLRVDVPQGDGFVTQFYGGSSIFCLTPTSEDVARSVASRNTPEPVHRWELPAPAAADDVTVGDFGDDLDDLDEDYGEDDACRGGGPHEWAELEEHGTGRRFVGCENCDATPAAYDEDGFAIPKPRRVPTS